MNCYYCDKIKASDADYVSSGARYNTGSEAPRCALHWRYVWGKCGDPSHFMSAGYDPEARDFFCSSCATAVKEVADAVWAWKYYFRYSSPWSGQWSTALDRLEFEGTHPLKQAATKLAVQAAISQEEYLARYPERLGFWRSPRDVTDADVLAGWNAGAERWDADYDEDGDRNRKYQSDEPMLELIGDVSGKTGPGPRERERIPVQEALQLGSYRDGRRAVQRLPSYRYSQ